MNKCIPPIALILLLFGHISALSEELIVGHFSVLEPTKAFPEYWERMVFPSIERRTSYSLVRDNLRTVVKAVSDASASGMIRYFSVPAEQRPWIGWQWKIDHVLDKGDVYSKNGDDYAARIYVAFEYSSDDRNWWQRLRHKTANLTAAGRLPGSALNYIWANKAPKGTVVSNPFTGNAMMFVVQSGNSAAGHWMTEKRNIVDDYRTAFGKKPPPIMGIAIMTDTDNTGESTTAYYGDIRLTDE